MVHEITEIQETFDVVKETITSLMKVSIIIRNATPQDRYSKAETAIKTPFLDHFDVSHVGHRFPKIENNMGVKERLGRVISKRRQFLLYCRSHRDKLSQKLNETDSGIKLTTNIKPSLLAKEEMSVNFASENETVC